MTISAVRTMAGCPVFAFNTLAVSRKCFAASRMVIASTVVGAGKSIRKPSVAIMGIGAAEETGRSLALIR